MHVIRNRLRRAILWAFSAVSSLAGMVLLAVGWTTVWVPDPSDTANTIPQPMSLAGPGNGLLVGGIVLAIVLLILDTYVGSLADRRTPEEPAAPRRLQRAMCDAQGARTRCLGISQTA